MRRAFIFGIVAWAIALFLLVPGFWWGDSLNAYIQGISGNYSAGQPVLMALLCTFTSHIIPGSLPIFLICITLYFAGFSLMVFTNIRGRIFAPVLFFVLSFYPLLFGSIGVIETEALQLALLSLFIPLVILLYRSESKRRMLYFALLILLLDIFYLARYDAIIVASIFAYWLAHAYFRTHVLKTFLITGCIVSLFFISGTVLNISADVGDTSEMKVSLFVTDLAAITAESGTNYMPDYCWKPILPQNERTVEKIQYGMINWKNSFYSYIYNIDPSIGLFTYNVTQYRSDIISRWKEAVTHHPFLYLYYHLKVFGYLITGDVYDMGLWSGVRLSHQNNSKLIIDRTAAVDSFLQRHGDRYAYKDSSIVYEKDERPISVDEQKELFSLVPERRRSDVVWMKWYSQIPRKTYNQTNILTEKLVLPALGVFRYIFRWFSCLFAYFCLLVFMLLFYRKRVRDSHKRFSLTILCLAGTLHLVLRVFIITDPVFRFGIISILLLFCAVVIALADRQNVET